MNNQPSPEDALQLLDNITANMTLSRADHVKVQQAVQILAEAIKPPEVPEEDAQLKKEGTRGR